MNLFHSQVRFVVRKKNSFLNITIIYGNFGDHLKYSTAKIGNCLNQLEFLVLHILTFYLHSIPIEAYIIAQNIPFIMQ